MSRKFIIKFISDTRMYVHTSVGRTGRKVSCLGGKDYVARRADHNNSPKGVNVVMKSLFTFALTAVVQYARCLTGSLQEILYFGGGTRLVIPLRSNDFGKELKVCREQASCSETREGGLSPCKQNTAVTVQYLLRYSTGRQIKSPP